MATWLTNESGAFDERVPITTETLAHFDTVAGALRNRVDARVAGNLSPTRFLLEDLQGRSVADAGKLATGGGKK